MGSHVRNANRWLDAQHAGTRNADGDNWHAGASHPDARHANAWHADWCLAKHDWHACAHGAGEVPTRLTCRVGWAPLRANCWVGDVMRPARTVYISRFVGLSTPEDPFFLKICGLLVDDLRSCTRGPGVWLMELRECSL